MRQLKWDGWIHQYITPVKCPDFGLGRHFIVCFLRRRTFDGNEVYKSFKNDSPITIQHAILGIGISNGHFTTNHVRQSISAPVHFLNSTMCIP